MECTLADGHALLAWVNFLYEGDWADAEAEWKRAIELNPNFGDSVYAHFLWVMKLPEEAMAQWGLSVSFLRKGMYEESLAEMKASYSSIGDREVEEALTQGYAQSGFRGAIRGAADLLAARAQKTYVNSFDVACLYAIAGDNDQAFEWLGKCLEERSPHMPYLDAYVELESLRSDPRFQDLVRKMTLPIEEKE